MDESYGENIPVDQTHTVSSIFDHYHKTYQIKIKSVFDITNSDQYYDINEWKKVGARPFKFKCPGKEVPPQNWTKMVLDKMNKEYENLKQEDGTSSAIAVHCTHGLNRTGYVAISWLMENGILNDVDLAIKTFEEHRGEKMEREYLTENLVKSYG